MDKEINNALLKKSLFFYWNFPTEKGGQNFRRIRSQIFIEFFFTILRHTPTIFVELSSTKYCQYIFELLDRIDHKIKKII